MAVPGKVAAAVRGCRGMGRLGPAGLGRRSQRTPGADRGRPRGQHHDCGGAQAGDGGVSPPEKVPLAQTSSGLLLQPPCPSQEALPWRQRGFGGTAAAGMPGMRPSWAGAAWPQPSCSLLGARCGGDMDGGGGTPPPAGHLAIGEREPQGLTRRLGSLSGAPCDKAGSMLPPALCLRRRTWGSRGEASPPKSH